MPARDADDLVLIEQAVIAAGAIARHYFGGDYKRWDKGKGQPVTDADIAIDTYLRETLTAARPDYGWLSEETKDDPFQRQRENVFIVDPIDGTVAFLKGLPEFSISVAAVRAGRPYAGVVLNPITGECFAARTGHGATLNGAPIKVSERRELEGCRIVGPRDLFAHPAWNVAPNRPWPPLHIEKRASIAYRLALVASGAFDAAIALSTKCDWDMAAGDLIVREAGGIVTAHDGAIPCYNGASVLKPSFVAAGPALHAAILERVEHIKLPEDRDMDEHEPKQLLHLVFGGELVSPGSIEFKDLKALDIVGIYPNYKAAHAAWKARAQATVDNAQMRYFVVHMHRLMEPRPEAAINTSPAPWGVVDAQHGLIPGNSGDLSAVARLIRVYMTGHWGALALAAFCMVITSVMTAALAWIIDPAIKEIFLDKNSHMVLVLPLGVLAVIAVRAVAGFGQDSILNAIAERIVALAQRDMFASQIGLDIGAQNANHSGELISKFIYDTGLLRNALTRGVAGFGKELITLLALIGVMLYQDWELTVISVVLLPPVAWVTERLGKSLRKYSTRGMEETGVLSKSLSEALSGRRIIKAYNLEGHAAELANRRIAERLKYLLRAVRARAAAVPSTDLIGGIAAAFTVAFAGYQGLQGHLEINEFSSFIAAMLLAQQPVRTLSQLWTTSAEGLSAARRIFSVIDAKPAIADRPGAAPLVLTGGGGAIAFQDVSFAYAQAGDARAIDHVSLDIAAGKKVALVGPSGAGKTTIFNLLLRFYDPSAGTIAIDGQDIGGVTLTSLRDHIALVTQEPFLFDETIAENIALGRPGASREEIEVAARAAAAHDFIVAMPLGYDSGVGEAGSKLSGGQRQRIAIARAMLRNAPILLLDEATSALDTESERQVQDALARLMRGRTTIVIAHRLSTVLNADRIYVMDRGRVVEAGTHGELLARAGLYARLYQHDLSDVEENALAAAGAG